MKKYGFRDLDRMYEGAKKTDPFSELIDLCDYANSVGKFCGKYTTDEDCVKYWVVKTMESAENLKKLWKK